MPTKGKRSKPANDDKFLFVNEDASTVLRSTKDTELDRSKQRHVQRQQFAKKRQGSAKPARDPPTCTSPPTTQGLDTLTLTWPQDEGPGFFSSTEYFNLFDPSITEDCTEAPADVSPFGTPSSASIPTSIQTYNVLSASTSPYEHRESTSNAPYGPSSILRRSSSRSHAQPEDFDGLRRPNGISSIGESSSSSGNIINPFSNTYLALEQWAPPLIQYYATKIFPSTFIVESRVVPIQLMRHIPALHADMQFCMTEASDMYALLAAASAAMLKHEGKLNLPHVGPDSYTRVPIFFKTKAIAALRQKLEQGQMDNRVAQDVYRLLATAVMLGDKPAAEAHFQAMTEIIRALGGLDRFDDYTRERMILLDMIRVSGDLGRPLFPLTWDPGAISQDLLAKTFPDDSSTEARKPLGSILQRHNLSSALSGDFSGLLSSLTDLLHVVRYSFHSHLAPNDFKWIILRGTAMQSRILSLELPEIGPLTAIAKCTKIAALIWIGAVLAEHQRGVLAQQSNTLRQTLEGNTGSQGNMWQEHLDLLLWVVVMGLWGAREEDRTCFHEVAQQTCKKLDIKTFVGLEHRLDGFFYVKEIQRKGLLEVAKAIGLETPPTEGA